MKSIIDLEKWIWVRVRTGNRNVHALRKHPVLYPGSDHRNPLILLYKKSVYAPDLRLRTHF